MQEVDIKWQLQQKNVLKKQFRLRNKSAFTATYRIKNSYYKNGLVLFVGLKKKEKYPTKVGFVVSKKTQKSAVKRNRLKRLMRESYRLLLKENSVGNSFEFMSLIFIGQKEALGKSFEEIQKTVRFLLEKINV